MGLFDYLSSDKRRERRLERNIRSANNKFKPKDYRQPALDSVISEAREGNEVAISGLLARFSVFAEPSSEDEKEKEWVFDALIDIGDKALPPIRRALRSAESVTWVHRTLRHIVTAAEYRKELLDILSDFDTEYERNPDRKLQTIMALADVMDDTVREAMTRFLEDVDETVRFQTAVALTNHGDEQSREPLLKTMCEDESLRIRNEIIDAFARLEWPTTGFKKKVESILPPGYRQDKNGKIVKLGKA